MPFVYTVVYGLLFVFAATAGFFFFLRSLPLFVGFYYSCGVVSNDGRMILFINIVHIFFILALFYDTVAHTLFFRSSINIALATSSSDKPVAVLHKTK